MKPGAFTLVFSLMAFAILPACRQNSAPVAVESLGRAYDTELDWNDPQRVIPLNYQQALGKRVFYEKCVWCHADSTPAGPSNRSNLNPNPPLINDGATLNAVSDEFLQNIVTLGGSAMGRSAMMSPWGRTLTQDEILAVIAFIRVVAQPPYQPSVQPKSQYTGK